MTKAFVAALLVFVSTQCWAGIKASNDSDADFDNGMFTLPELKNPKDSYLIVVTPRATGTAPLKLSLPAGTTGIRIAARALPVGLWDWSYKVSTETPAPITLATLGELTLGAGDLTKAGRYTLAWTPVAGAKKYAISGQSRTKDKATDDPEWSKLDAACFASVCARGQIATYTLDLKPGTELKWQVSAVDEYGIVLAKSMEAHLSVQNTAIQGAKAAGFSFQRSDTLSKATAIQPATLSYLSALKEGASRTSAYQSEFALIYDAATAWNDFYPRVSLEGHLTSSGGQKASDALRFRVGAYRELQGSSPDQGTEVVSNLKYEAERKSGTKKGLIELGFTPIYGFLGSYWPGPPSLRDADVAGNYKNLPWARFAPTLILSTEVGKTFEVGSSAETKDTVVRLKAILRLDAELNAVSSLLGARNVSAYLEGSYWYLPREDETRNYRLGKAGLSFGLTENLSFDLSYLAGRDAPTFASNRTTSAGFGLKF